MALSKRIRVTENEYNYLQIKRLTDKKVFTTLWFSDCHGWLCDRRALGAINEVLKHNHFDEVGINGDIVDMPYVSKHAAKIYEEGVMQGYSEIKEIEHTKDIILKPLRESTEAKIRVRLGNHDERITKPFNLNQSQSNRLQVLNQHFNQFKFDKLLGIEESNGWIYDPSDCYTYFDKFDIVHGLKMTAGTAAKRNIEDRFGSGASGHTHRLQATYITKKSGVYVWLEMGCTRLIEQVEYLPTATVANHQHGFVTITFYTDGDKVRFYAKPHFIYDGVTEYNGTVYRSRV